MTAPDVVRSWKDPHFRASLPDGERAVLPESPVGLVEIPDARLDSAAGANEAECTTMIWPCTYDQYLTMYCCPITW